ncbi:MAG: phosphodiesterase [Christensenellales bacterium]|nr:phosphodiesterase [Christensenellales bacterium]
MKLMIASDIHGSALWCQRMLKALRKEQADKLLLLGDLLYHGPRNMLPDEYDPSQVIRILNDVRSRLICVRGNCEAEVDQMVLDFPVMGEMCVLLWEGRVMYATHGHRHSEENPPPLAKDDILLGGHTHVPACRSHEGFLYLNPGSVSIPKNGTPHSYAVLEGMEICWKDLADGREFQRASLMGWGNF